jgi:hypothetical protein
MNDNLIISYNSPVFTRYLYVVNDVFHSLQYCLFNPLEKTLDEAMFWAFELYYSGFEYETIEYLKNIYISHFEERFSKKFSNFMKSKFAISIKKPYIDSFSRTNKKDDWNGFNKQFWKDENVAIITANIYIRNKQILNNNNNKINNVNKKVSKLIIVNYTPDDIQLYKTFDIIQEPPHLYKSYRILSNHCIFDTIKINYHALYLNDNVLNIKLYNREQLKDMFHYQWLYYCYFTPIWRNRIDKYGGQIDHINKLIIFPDDNEDEFYTLYGYEPDENPLEVFKMCIGV